MTITEYKRKHNLERRKERRASLHAFPDTSAAEFSLDEEMFPVPTIADVKEALRTATHSKEDILNMAGVMELVSMHYSPRLLEDIDGKCDRRTSGIREFLRKDGYLISRYSTLMRYKALADEIRIALGLDRFTSFRIGLLEENPDPSDDYWYSMIREFILGIPGENYKDIFAHVHARVQEKREEEERQRLRSAESSAAWAREAAAIQKHLLGSYHHEIKKERVKPWWEKKEKSSTSMKPNKKKK